MFDNAIYAANMNSVLQEIYKWHGSATVGMAEDKLGGLF